ncbi:MAG TPA: hypothetical protein V6C81_19610 [Planktothrix sp.]|jgi:hypothetical protein
MFLYSAQDALKIGDLRAAEQQYIHALQCVEHAADKEVGMSVVLMELAQFYADNGQQERAQVLWTRVRDHLADSLEHIARPGTATISSV